MSKLFGRSNLLNKENYLMQINAAAECLKIQTDLGNFQTVRPTFTQEHGKINKMTCAPNTDSDQPGLNTVFVVRLKKVWVPATHKAYNEDSGWTGGFLVRAGHNKTYKMTCASSGISADCIHVSGSLIESSDFTANSQ